MLQPTNALKRQEYADVFCCETTAEYQSQIIIAYFKNTPEHSFIGCLAPLKKKNKYYKALLALACFTMLNINDLNAKPYFQENMATINLPAGQETTAPIGYREMCASMPHMCTPKYGRAVKVNLNDKNLNELNTVNLHANTSIRPATDIEHLGVVEKWSLPINGAGDCEDYVLLKRKILIDKGWPEENLLITVVRDLKNDGHAVLTVVTDKGDLILDNQNNEIKLWFETGYSFIKRQSQELVTKWVSLKGKDTLPNVASNR